MTKFRDYSNAKSKVVEFYKQNHQLQTLEFVLSKKKQYSTLSLGQRGVWEVLEYLDGIVDESDPDTENSQLQHALQSAESARANGEPRWMILAVLIHDLGKMLCINNEPQIAVVGDTFPVGCRYSQKIVFPEFFELNPDFNNPEYQSLLGIYEKNCGLDNVHMSWGHDEYLYMVMKPYLSAEALFVIRYHSFYACHSENEYEYLMNEKDKEMMQHVKRFNKYDLYTKDRARVQVENVKGFYMEIISEFIPDLINW